MPRVAESAGGVSGSWNPVRDLESLLEYHFMVNALAAGTIVAALAALVGWMMVLRGETFAGHTLSTMAFPGAAAAALAGVPQAWGYYLLCALGAGALGGMPSRGREEEAAGIGAFQALALALGFLLVTLYGGVLGDLETLLFGNLLGVGDAQVLSLAIVAAVAIATLALLGRPLLFASVERDVARARGVPVRRLGVAFMLVLGLTVAATSQVTGPLLVFSLLAMPAASAQALTARPALGLALAVLIAVAVVWLGLAAAYFSAYPPGCYVAGVSFAAYVLARALAVVRARARVHAPLPLRREGVIS